MKKDYYKWGIVLYGFILMFTVFAIIKSCHALFVVPVTSSLGISRGSFSLVFTITGLAVALASPVVSRLLAKNRLKLVLFTSILCAGIGFGAYSLATKLWHFYLLSFVVGVGVAGGTNIPIAMLVNNWFIDRKGFVMGVTFAGSGLGLAVLSPIISYFFVTRSWQFSYVFCSILILAVCLPATMKLAHQYPKDKGCQPYLSAKNRANRISIEKNAGMNGISVQEAKKTVLFWVFLAFVFSLSLVSGGIHLCIPAYLADLGYAQNLIALIYSAVAIALIIGKMGFGILFDKLGAKAGLVFLGTVYTIAIVLLISAGNPVVALIFTLFFGLSVPVTTVGFPFLAGAIFGTKDYVNILGIVNVFYIVGIALGPLVSNLIFDLNHSYLLAWKIYLITIIVAISSLFYFYRKQLREGTRYL